MTPPIRTAVESGPYPPRLRRLLMAWRPPTRTAAESGPYLVSIFDLQPDPIPGTGPDPWDRDWHQTNL